MSTTRVYIATDHVTVSKPGFDAESPPALDYKYLALDSRMNNGRPLEMGFIPTLSVNLIVNFTTTYPGIPGVDLIVLTNIAGGNYAYWNSIVMRDDNGSTAINRTPFYLGV